MNNYYRSDGWVKAVQGPAIPGAQIYVCTQPANVTPPITPPRTLPVPWGGPTPQAQIFSDAGVTPITQPIITDGFGHYDFYTLPGLYTVVVMFGGKVQQFYIDQTVGNAGSSNPSPLVLSTNGTPNFNQSNLNFTQGAGITLATDNLGNMTITGSSIPTPPPPTMTNTVGGLVPTPPNDATQFLNGAGVFSAPAGGSGPLQSVTVNISSAQIRALNTTPVTLVAGQAGKVIIPRQILFNYIYGGTVYGGTASGDVWWANLTSFNGVSIANISFNMLTQNTNQFFIALAAANGFFWNGASANIIGQGIIFKAETSNPTLGNGTLSVQIEYEVISGIV